LSFCARCSRSILECGIFAHGFARASCEDCGHDFLVAFSCKGQGVCSSYNIRRMVETAAHLSDHMFPRLTVPQWVLAQAQASLRKRILRAFVGRGSLEGFEALEMLAYRHSEPGHDKRGSKG
jgi:hypothetical protein